MTIQLKTTTQNVKALQEVKPKFLLPIEHDALAAHALTRAIADYRASMEGDLPNLRKIATAILGEVEFRASTILTELLAGKQP